MAQKKIQIEGKQVFYRVEGKGQPLVLIHGYQADSNAWNWVTPFLKEKYMIITPDLPGHGQSPLIRTINDMDFLARCLFQIINSLNLQEVVLAGHSMGGYVALAFANQFPGYVNRLFLINSHPFADNMNKLIIREKESQIIQNGKKHFLLTGFIKNNFAPTFRCKQKKQIQEFTQLALQQAEDGMLADIVGMMARTDNTHIAQKLKKRIQVILGAEDVNVPDHKFKDVSDLFDIHVVSDCGHMSIIEKPQEIASFLL